jgi:hypothetical protein
MRRIGWPRLLASALGPGLCALAHGSIVYDVEMAPEVARHYRFAEPVGARCSTLETREQSFAVRCGSHGAGDAGAGAPPPNIGEVHVDIIDKASGEVFNTLYAYESLQGGGRIELPGYASCDERGGCENPDYLGSGPVPSLHYEDEFAVFYLNKVGRGQD